MKLENLLTLYTFTRVLEQGEVELATRYCPERPRGPYHPLNNSRKILVPEL